MVERLSLAQAVYRALRALHLSELSEFLAVRLPCPLARTLALGMVGRLSLPEMQAHY